MMSAPQRNTRGAVSLSRILENSRTPKGAGRPSLSVATPEESFGQKGRPQTLTQIKNAEKAKRSRDALKAIKDELEECTRSNEFYEEAEKRAGPKPKAGDSEGYKLNVTRIVIELLNTKLEELSRGGGHRHQAAGDGGGGAPAPPRQKRHRVDNPDLNFPPPSEDRNMPAESARTQAESAPPSRVRGGSSERSMEEVLLENRDLKEKVDRLNAEWALQEAAMVERTERKETLLEDLRQKIRELKTELNELKKKDFKMFYKSALLLSQNTPGESQSQPIPGLDEALQSQEDVQMVEDFEELGRDLDFANCEVAPEGLGCLCTFTGLLERARSHTPSTLSSGSCAKTVIQLRAGLKRHRDGTPPAGSAEFNTDLPEHLAVPLGNPYLGCETDDMAESALPPVVANDSYQEEELVVSVKEEGGGRGGVEMPVGCQRVPVGYQWSSTPQGVGNNGDRDSDVDSIESLDAP